MPIFLLKTLSDLVNKETKPTSTKPRRSTPLRAVQRLASQPMTCSVCYARGARAFMTGHLRRVHAALPSAWVAWGASGGARWHVCARRTVPFVDRHLASVPAPSLRHGNHGTLVRTLERHTLAGCWCSVACVAARDLNVAGVTDRPC